MGNALHQIGAVGERLIDGCLHGVGDAVRQLNVLDALHLELHCGRNAEGGSQIAMRNLICPEGRLQIVIGLGGSAPGLQHVGQGCQSVLEPGAHVRK